MSRMFYDDGKQIKLGLNARKVCLATTAYDSPDASYTFSIQRSRLALEANGIQTAYMLLSGNCHVDDARNSVVQEFLLTDCTELVFIDADVSWSVGALLRLCSHDVAVVGGVYPFRRDDVASRGNMPVRMVPGIYEPGPDGLMEVEGLPTGFMKIKREVLEAIIHTCNSYWGKGDNRSRIPVVFERTLEGDLRWGGDLNFCRKWKSIGGLVWADTEMRLGHVAKSVITDSLGSALRRQRGITLKWVCDQLRNGSEDLDLFSEVLRDHGNEWSALEDSLALCTFLARKVDGPIIETGSGISTILMAAVSPYPVYAIEHDPRFESELYELANKAGVSDNIWLCSAPIKNGWYDIDEFDGLPDHFSLGFCDGPPRTLATRMPFYDHIAPNCDQIVVDDIDELGYYQEVSSWCERNDRSFMIVDGRAALIGSQPQEQDA